MNPTPAHSLYRAARSLLRDGFQVRSARLADGRPTIEVAADSRTEEMVALDLATHYKWLTINGTPERWGQFAAKPHGVRVVFVERPQ